MCLMDLFQGVGEGGALEFFINKTAEALIPFNVEHQGLLKLHAPLEWNEFLCGKKMGRSSKEKMEKQCVRRLLKTY